METEYIDLSQAMRDVLTFLSLMKDIELLLKLQGDTPAVMYSIFKNKVTVHEDNQRAIALAVASKMWPRTKHIAIKYHHFRSFVVNGDVEIQHIDIKEQITDIFMKPIDYELFGYIRYNNNSW